jgi:hypothetical protein
MRRFAPALLTFLLLAPTFVIASSCSPNGYTSIFINGILTSQADALVEAQKLQDKLGYDLNGESLTVRLGYNATHLGGLGDKIESLTQAFSHPLSDFDLNTILMQIHPEVTTRKILLVGHSQGAFYTDEMYEYLVRHGVPKQSIAVYNIATPESYVAGGGGYLTSTNDKVINWVREQEVQGNLQAYLNSYYTYTKDVVHSALRANTTIPKEGGWDTDQYGGHHFSVYLDGAGDRIVSDIDRELENLSVPADATTSLDGCFTPPTPDLVYKTESALFSVGDSTLNGVAAAGSGTLAFADTAYGALASGFSALQGALGFSKLTQVAAAAVPVSDLSSVPETPVSASAIDTSEPPAPAAAADTPTVNVAAPSPPQEQPVMPNSTVALQATPGFGGGGGGAQEQTIAATANTNGNATTTPDTTPPAEPSVSIADCNASLVAGGCLVATTTIGVSWNTDTDVASYGVAKNGTVAATTTATSMQFMIAEGATTSISVVAYDAAGNAATSSTYDVAAIIQPLLINEIGWGGTDADSSQQWVELKNNTQFDIDLSHVALARSGGPSVALAGTLPSTQGGNFFFIGPAINGLNSAHGITYAFTPPLATTTAEQLSLVWNDATTLDATPATVACGSWCAGAYHVTLGTNLSGFTPATSPLSMERRSGASDGSLSTSWQSTDTYGSTGGVAVSAVWGTPGGENSRGLPDAGVYCGSASNLLTQIASPGPSFNPSSDPCTFLSRFIATPLNAAQTNRVGGLYRGDVASSTSAGYTFLFGSQFATPVNFSTLNAQSGEHFFFAIWENRTFGNDNFVFDFYFTQGASSTQGIAGPPHGNYVVFPFVFSP